MPVNKGSNPVFYSKKRLTHPVLLLLQGFSFKKMKAKAGEPVEVSTFIISLAGVASAGACRIRNNAQQYSLIHPFPTCHYLSQTHLTSKLVSQPVIRTLYSNLANNPTRFLPRRRHFMETQSSNNAINKENDALCKNLNYSNNEMSQFYF